MPERALVVASADHLVKRFYGKPRGKNYWISFNFCTVIDVKNKSKICLSKEFAPEQRTRWLYNQKTLNFRDNSSPRWRLAKYLFMTVEKVGVAWHIFTYAVVFDVINEISLP